MKKYDVAIIGGGIGGLMTAYKLLQKNDNLEIIIIEKGRDIAERRCPLIEKIADQCLNCPVCSVMSGLSGAGAFSDGKFIISTEYGGTLQDIIGDGLTQQYMNDVDHILMKFGAPTNIFVPDASLINLCEQSGLVIKKGIVKHFGTENNLRIMGALIDCIKQRCAILTQCTVTDVQPNNHLIYTDLNGEPMFAENIVFAIGRSGGKFFSEWCDKYSIKTFNRNVDLGVRVELKAEIWKNISAIAYDPKISYISELYKDETRMFCFNDGGHVVLENTFGSKTVNGHAYQNEDLKSENSNFALLTSIKLTEPFNNPIEYVNLIANNVNYISGGTVVVQRFGDLVSGRRTTNEKLSQSSVKPTLAAAYPGDLSLCVPKRQLDSIIETIYKLDRIAPGTAHEDTLLYGIEGKYYSSIPHMLDFEIFGYSKVYVCGDGSGITRSLAQAGANGFYISDKILSGGMTSE